MTIGDIEKQLCDISHEIGSIAECNGTFTVGLAMSIADYGKPIKELTIAELLELYKKRSDSYQKIFGHLA